MAGTEEEGDLKILAYRVKLVEDGFAAISGKLDRIAEMIEKGDSKNSEAIKQDRDERLKDMQALDRRVTIVEVRSAMIAVFLGTLGGALSFLLVYLSKLLK